MREELQDLLKSGLGQQEVESLALETGAPDWELAIFFEALVAVRTAGPRR